VAGGADRTRRLVLVACILGSGIVFLDGTVVNVGLPAIRADLHAGLTQQQWVVEAYLLTLSSLLLIGGALGDRLGRRRIFTAGLAGFGGCSLVCALAPSSGVLIGARAAQGVAGALLVPSTLALIMDTFDERTRGQAIGTWTAWTGIATVIGPLGGGLLIQLASWRWIFAINLVPVLGTMMLLRHLPAGSRSGDHVDVVGALLAALGLGGPVFALIEQPHYGWGNGRVFGPLAGGLLLLACFLAWERRSPAPMVPLTLFGVRNFSAGNLTTLALYAGLNVAVFFLVLFVQQVGGYRPIEAGLALLPVTAMIFALSKRFGALADRFGPRAFMGGGPMVAGVGLLLLMRVSAGAQYAETVLPGLLVFGLGMALTVAPLTATVLGAVEPGHSGVASGINNAVARVAGLVAIAALGAVVSGAFSARLDQEVSRAAQARQLAPATRAVVARERGRPLVVDVSGAAPADWPVLRAALVRASVHGFRVGMLISALLAVLGGLISLVGIVNPRREEVHCAECPGGALVGASPDAAPAPVPGPPGGGQAAVAPARS
jgi:EmrB/QacA subfamily drug resistance transporter